MTKGGVSPKVTTQQNTGEQVCGNVSFPLYESVLFHRLPSPFFSVRLRIAHKIFQGGGVPPKGSKKMPSPFPKPCIRCGTLSVNNLCDFHMAQMKAKDNARGNARKARTNQYGGAYKKLAQIIRQTAEVCHICGQGYRPNDPFEADHLTPGIEVVSLGQLAPAHRSCNIARGNKPLK